MLYVHVNRTSNSLCLATQANPHRIQRFDLFLALPRSLSLSLSLISAPTSLPLSFSRSVRRVDEIGHSITAYEHREAKEH